MNNLESLKANFPEAVSLRRYLTRVRDSIEPIGFNRSNTFTVSSVCRDELTQILVSEVANFWQHPFDVGGLAGLPPVGEETWRVALSHVPDKDGRGKILVFAASHMGIAPDGTLGQIHRYGQSSPNAACGALGLAAQAIRDPTAYDAERSEYGLLSHSEAARLVHTLVESVEPELAEDMRGLTIACANIIHDSIWQALDSLDVHLTNDIVVASGVQIHFHDDFDFFYPTTTDYKDASGKVTPINLS